jgi:hypothetical protein
METIVPATADWRICVLAPIGALQRTKLQQFSIIAWRIDLRGQVTPITAFGPYEPVGEYVIADPAGTFIRMPEGETLEGWNGAEEYLRSRGAA